MKHIVNSEAARFAKSPRLIALCTCVGLVSIPGTAAWLGSYLPSRTDVAKTEIYHGVFYESRSNGNGNGVVHLVEVDLKAPGIDLYLTPVDVEAAKAGHQYRLEYVRNVAHSENLAVAINATYFRSDSYLMSMVGDFATSVESIVSNYQLNHLDPRDNFLWFDESLVPHVEVKRPVPMAVLEKAKWAIGNRRLAVRRRSIREDSADARTALGIAPEQHRLWIGVFEQATQSDAAETLLDAGAQYVLLLDGGSSTSLYLGGRAHNVPRGLRFGGQRPVATVFGIKAFPIIDD